MWRHVRRPGVDGRQHLAGGAGSDWSRATDPHAPAPQLGAEALRADLAGIAEESPNPDAPQRRAGSRSGPPEIVPSRLVGRLNRIAPPLRPPIATVDDLRDRLDGIAGQMTASRAERSAEVDRALGAALARFETMLGDLEQGHERRLDEVIAQGERQLGVLSKSLDLVSSRLEYLTEIAQPMLAALEGLREEQGRLGVQSADWATAVDDQGERSRRAFDDSAGVLLARLDRLAAMAGPGFDSIGELRSCWDELVERATAHDGATRTSEDRLAQVSAELNRTVAGAAQMSHDGTETLRREVAAALTRLETVLTDVGRSQDRHSAELTEQLEGRLDGLPEALEQVRTQLDGASERLDRMAEQMAEDTRGQMTTLDLGLRVALSGIEGVVAERRGEQLAQIADARHEVAESFIQGLSRFGQQVDAGLQHATEELTASVFLVYEESDNRSKALQDEVTKTLARVEEAELGRDQHLIDLRRLVDRLSTDVQLLRPAIDLRADPDHGLDDVMLARFAGRVAALLADQPGAGVEAQTGSALEIPLTARSSARLNEWERLPSLILPPTQRRPE
jgi:hypothetical protein